MRTSWIKQGLFLSILWSFSLVFLVGITELTFGNWLGNDPWAAVQQFNVIRNQQFSHDASHLGLEQKPVVYTRDKFGLRGNCGNLKFAQIVTVGGSTTDQRAISDGETWQELLQNRIQAYINSGEFCIVNAGVDGHSTFGHLKSFATWFPLISDLTPRYYLLYIGLNDAGFRFEAHSGFDNIPNQSVIGKMIRENSAVYQMVKLARARLGNSHPVFAGHRFVSKTESLYPVDKPTANVDVLIAKNANHFERRLRKILEYISSRGATPICVSQPHALAWDFGEGLRGINGVFSYDGVTYNGLDFNLSLAEINKVMSRVCTNEGGVYIDLAKETFKLDDFYDYAHLTPVATVKVANHLYEALKNRGILERIVPRQ